MTHELKPITITEQQIIAAAQRIADAHDDAWEHTADEYLAATEHWLRCVINDRLVGAGYYATNDGNFHLDPKYQMPRCDAPALPFSEHCETHAFYTEAETATELVMPQPPEWAYDTIEHSIQ